MDKVRTGFIAWTPTIKGYKAVLDDSVSFIWDKNSSGSLDVIREGIGLDTYFKDLLTLWGQESSRTGSLDLRSDHVAFIKRLGKHVLRGTLCFNLPIEQRKFTR